MFKKIVIELTTPICNCGVQKLSWCVQPDKETALQVWCQKCKTKLMVPNEKFVASFDLEEEYPEDESEIEETTKGPTDNVIPFPLERIPKPPKDSA